MNRKYSPPGAEGQDASQATSEHCVPDTPVKPEQLQHALRSPLQGALLFLDLMREDAQHGTVALEDIDSVIDALTTVVRILDEHRDKETGNSTLKP